MKPVKILSSLTLAILCSAATASSVSAALTPIGIGKSVTPGTTTFTGTQVGTDLTIPFANPAETGSVTEEIFRQTDTTLDFYFQVSNDSTSTDSVDRITLTDFTGFVTSVGYIPDSGTTLDAYNDPISGDLVPFDATRAKVTGNTIGFDFPLSATEIDPGTTSDIFEVATDATLIGPGTISIIDGATNTHIDLGPTTVPEPSTWALIMGGLGMLCAFTFRRMRIG